MAQSNRLPAAGEPQDGIRYGRRAPVWTPVPEWVIVAGLSAPALALYVALLAHVNRGREDGKAWPGMPALCEILGFSQRKTVRRYLNELVELGAVDVESNEGSMLRRNVYVVHELPLAGYAGPQNLTEFYKARKTAAQAPRGTHVPLATGSDEPLAVGAQVPQNQTNSTRRSEQDESSKSSTPSRAHSAERARENAARNEQAKANRQQRREWELPPKDNRAWLDDRNLALAESIYDWVDNRYGYGAETANMVESMLVAGYAPMRVLNAALKQAREAHCIEPGDPVPDYLLNAPEPVISRPVWDDQSDGYPDESWDGKMVGMTDPLRTRDEAAVHAYRQSGDRAHLDLLRQDGLRQLAHALTMEHAMPDGKRGRYTAEVDKWLGQQESQ